MPYIISKQGNKYLVRKRGADGRPVGAVLGTHPSEGAARGQVAAIYSNEKKSQKPKKAQGPEAQRLAGSVLSAVSKLPYSFDGDPRFKDAYDKFRAACQQYSGFWERVAAGQASGNADAQASFAARRLSMLATAMQGAGRSEQTARAATVAIIARQLAGALSGGKSVNKARKARTLKAWSRLDVSRMNVIQLKREIVGLRSIQKAARSAINQLNQIQQSLAKANQQLPEDNALGEAMHEIGVALAVLGNERNLSPIIREAETLYEQKQKDEAGLLELREKQKPQPQQKPRGLFGLFGRS